MIAAAAAVLASNLADDEKVPAKRQSRDEVDELVKATGLDGQMKLFGPLDGYVSGERGPAPEAKKGKAKGGK